MKLRSIILAAAGVTAVMAAAPQAEAGGYQNGWHGRYAPPPPVYHHHYRPHAYGPPPGYWHRPPPVRYMPPPAYYHRPPPPGVYFGFRH